MTKAEWIQRAALILLQEYSTEEVQDDVLNADVTQPPTIGRDIWAAAASLANDVTSNVALMALADRTGFLHACEKQKVPAPARLEAALNSFWSEE